MRATWLLKGGILNTWEEICFREDLGRKSWGWKNTHIKTAPRGRFGWECLQYASISRFFVIIVWACSFCPLLGRRTTVDLGTGFMQSIDISSSRTVRPGNTREGDGLDIGRQHVRRFDLLRHTHKPQKLTYPICANWRGHVWHWCGGGWAGLTLYLAGLFQGGE